MGLVDPHIRRLRRTPTHRVRMVLLPDSVGGTISIRTYI